VDDVVENLRYTIRWEGGLGTPIWEVFWEVRQSKIPEAEWDDVTRRLIVEEVENGFFTLERRLRDTPWEIELRSEAGEAILAAREWRDGPKDAGLYLAPLRNGTNGSRRRIRRRRRLDMTRANRYVASQVQCSCTHRPQRSRRKRQLDGRARRRR